MNENGEKRKPIQAERSVQPISTSEVIRNPIAPPVQSDQIEANQKAGSRSPKRVDRPLPEELLAAHLAEQESQKSEPMRTPIVPPQTEE